MKIDRLDHLVLTVRDVDVSVRFYVDVLGMTAIEFDGRKAVKFGSQKINFHQAGREISPHANRPTAGSGDLCFVAVTLLDEVLKTLEQLGVPIEEGPVERSGATGKIRSIYVRDPDENLIEISNYVL